MSDSPTSCFKKRLKLVKSRYRPTVTRFRQTDFRSDAVNHLIPPKALLMQSCCSSPQLSAPSSLQKQASSSSHLSTPHKLLQHLKSPYQKRRIGCYNSRSGTSAQRVKEALRHPSPTPPASCSDDKISLLRK